MSDLGLLISKRTKACLLLSSRVVLVFSMWTQGANLVMKSSVKKSKVVVQFEGLNVKLLLDLCCSPCSLLGYGS